MPSSETLDLGEAVRAMVAAIVRETLPVLLAEIAPQLAPRDSVIDAATFAAEGLGTARQFTDGAHSGAFPTFKGGASGRAPVATRSEVLTWLATRTTRRKLAPSIVVANDNAPSTMAEAYAAIVASAG